ncbi:hydantoin racemase [Bacillus sp. OxB-1]|uniref:aspartate/glutamate racemase family protein n=1 Tax=Bacillus sp. (strain OxB-1) TaxID=98228 RepID=UPI000581C31C|nr:aspartate/glutamate racemase family protein [Bacillus sp. OxB-1]BAQ08896.1 hydantoin racemase [Bacillus sp. OxB-1]
MKIKIINPDVNEEITAMMKESAKAVASKETVITCTNPAAGPKSIDNAFTKEIACYHILEEIIKSEKEGSYDGYVIGCFADPAVHAARELTDKPVVGIGESSIMLARFVSENFSIITVGPWSRWVYKEVVSKCNAANRLASLRSPVIASADSFTNRDYVKELIIRESRNAIEEDFAEVIILGCGVMTGLAKEMEEIVKVPVIDPVAAGVKVVESLIGLGLHNSKIYSYKTPQNPELINVPGLLNL